MPITNNADTPDLPEEGRDIKRVYIQHTQGIWIRLNREKREVEFWFDGNLISAFENNALDVQQANIPTLIADAVNLGKKLRSAEIKKLIG